MAEKVYIMDPTNFIFETHFAGDPTLDKYNSTTRYCNIIIPTQEMADELANIGLNVKVTKPSDEYEQKYFTKAIANFNSKFPPEIYIVYGDGVPERLTAETVGRIDQISVDHIQVSAQPCWLDKYNCWAFYIQQLYVHQGIGRDPFASAYNWER